MVVYVLVYIVRVERMECLMELEVVETRLYQSQLYTGTTIFIPRLYQSIIHISHQQNPIVLKMP
jgi:hypothetical protein